MRVHREEHVKEHGREHGRESRAVFGMGLHTKLSDILNNSFIVVSRLTFLSCLRYLFVVVASLMQIS